MRALGIFCVSSICCFSLHAQTKSQIEEAWSLLATPVVQYQYQYEEVGTYEGKICKGEQFVDCILADSKFIVKRSGTDVEPSVVTTRQHIVLDGADYYVLDYVGEQTTGRILRHGAIEINDRWIFPVLLAHFPKRALHLSFLDFDSLELTAGTEFVQGSECICLVTTSNKQAPDAETRVLLDPAANFAIRAIILENAGRPVVEKYFSYDGSNNLNMLREFQTTVFDDEGQSQSEISGRVVKKEVLANIDPRLFEVEFPDGTPVRETDKSGSDTEYRQTGDVLKRLNSQDEGGVVSLGLISSLVVIVALFSVICFRFTRSS